MSLLRGVIGGVISVALHAYGFTPFEACALALVVVAKVSR